MRVAPVIYVRAYEEPCALCAVLSSHDPGQVEPDLSPFPEPAVVFQRGQGTWPRLESVCERARIEIKIFQMLALTLGAPKETKVGPQLSLRVFYR